MQYAQETAIVSHIKDEYAFLKTRGSSGCGGCTLKPTCGSASLFSFTPDTNLKVMNTLGLRAGDSVIVSMSSGKLMLGTVLIYLLPLLALFSFAVIGKMLVGEITSIMSGLGGLFLALFFVKKYIDHRNVALQFEPKMLRKIIQVDTG